MKHITVVDGHPDALRARLNHALADRYAEAAQEAGADVRRVDIASIDFPLLRNATDFYDASAPKPLTRAQEDIAWANHVVFFYPLWHGTMPAVFKGFIEQIFRPGFSMAYGGKARFPKQLLKGKSARVVVTMGMPAAIYRFAFGAYGVKGFERSVLGLSGISPVSETLLGGAGGACESRARKWLDLMAQFGERDVNADAWKRRNLRRRTLQAVALLAVSYAAFVAIASRGNVWVHESRFDVNKSADGSGDGKPEIAGGMGEGLTYAGRA